MAEQIGSLSKMAFKRNPGLQTNGAVAYPGPTGATIPNLATGTTKIPFLSEGVKVMNQQLDSKAFVGEAGYANSEIQSKRVSGPVKAEAYYEGAIPEMVCCAMGFENASIAATGSPYNLTGAYRHVFELDNNLKREGWLAGEGRLVDPAWLAGDLKVRDGLLGIDRVVSAERIKNCAFNQMTVNFTPESVDYEFDLIGYERQFKTAGEIGSAAWALPSVKYRGLFTSMEIRLGTLTTGLGFDWQEVDDVASAQIIQNNNLKGDDQTTGSGFFIPEPPRNDFREVTIGLNLRSHNTIVLMEEYDANTLFKMWIKTTGANIPGTGFYYAQNFYFPAIKLIDASANIANAGINPPDYMFKAFLPLTAPSNWMTSNKFANQINLVKGNYIAGGVPPAYGSEMLCEFINTKGTNYLTYY